MKAWTFQDHRQKQKLGEKKCPWSVGWYAPSGRKRSKQIGSKSMAEKFRRKKEGELAAGLCRVGPEHVAWARFRREYEETIMPKWRSEESRLDARHALNIFERLVKPKRVDAIDEHILDVFVAKRLKMRGKKRGDTVAPATVGKDLRTIRAALGQAKRWKYLANVPQVPEVDGFQRDKPFVTEKHFAAMMEHCDSARLPADQHFTAAVFWRALLGLAMVTGMRKSAILALLWEDVDLGAGVALSGARDNKGKRDQRHNISPVTGLLADLYAVRKLGERRVFPWNYSDVSMQRNFARIQNAAGIHLPCREDHEHTPACHRYGFHSFRYSFAQHNEHLTHEQLQEQMGHRSGTTTDGYIDYGKRQRAAEVEVFVPKVLKVAAG